MIPFIKPLIDLQILGKLPNRFNILRDLSAKEEVSPAMRALIMVSNGCGGGNITSAPWV